MATTFAAVQAIGDQYKTLYIESRRVVQAIRDRGERPTNETPEFAALLPELRAQFAAWRAAQGAYLGERGWQCEVVSDTEHWARCAACGERMRYDRAMHHGRCDICGDCADSLAGTSFRGNACAACYDRVEARA
ncbi:MAG TPA: hypothetical protein VFA70_10145 [Dehalococcoidia bacterium]|nr:hypothetical protein [Dehalococcoidia bacterium]